MVKRKLKTLKAASLELGISYSQAKRIYRRYLSGWDKALVHGSKGKPPNKKTDEDAVKKTVELYGESITILLRHWSGKRLLRGKALQSAQAPCGGHWYPLGYGNRKRTVAQTGLSRLCGLKASVPLRKPTGSCWKRTCQR